GVRVTQAAPSFPTQPFRNPPGPRLGRIADRPLAHIKISLYGPPPCTPAGAARVNRSSSLFTSESVSEGHPDKVSDQISDAIVDLFLSKDPEARVACETRTTTNRIILAGEVRGKGILDPSGDWAPGVRDEIEATARNVVRDIGYE